MTAVIPAGQVRHIEPVDLVGRRWRLGALLLIFADVSFVVSMVFAYFYLRGLNTQGGWLPKGVTSASIWVGWAIAAGTVLSALAYRRGLAGIETGDNKLLVRGSGLAVLVLVVVAVGQLVQLANFPFKVDDSSYASATYLLGAANFFHLLLTLFLGVGIWNRGRLTKYSTTDNWQVRIVGMWWTWIAIAAIIGAFTTSFITSPHILVGNG